MTTRLAVLGDAGAIARIYNEGIEDRVATFETRLRSAADIEKWFDGTHPLIVVEAGGRVIAFAATSEYRPRACYAGVAEVSLYVERASRRRGAGRVAMLALIEAAGGSRFLETAVKGIRGKQREPLADCLAGIPRSGNL